MKTTIPLICIFTIIFSGLSFAMQPDDIILERPSPELAKKIIAASKENDHIALRSLLKPSLTLDRVMDEDGKTPLHFAAALGHYEIAEMLIAAHCSVDSIICSHKNTGWLAIHLASFYGHTKIVELLVEHGSNPGQTVESSGLSQGCTPLHTSVQHQKENVETIAFLLRAGASPQAESSSNLLKGCTPLHYAAMNNLPNAANLLLCAGANVNSAIQSDLIKNSTPLERALDNNHFEVLRILIKAGAKKPTSIHSAQMYSERIWRVYAESPLNRTLVAGSFQDFLSIIALLKKGDKKKYCQNLQEALVIAYGQGLVTHQRILLRELDEYAVNIVSLLYQALIFAAARGDVATVKTLLTKLKGQGALNDKHSLEQLMLIAVRNCHAKVIGQLYVSGASTEAAERYILSKWRQPSNLVIENLYDLLLTTWRHDAIQNNKASSLSRLPIEILAIVNNLLSKE